MTVTSKYLSKITKIPDVGPRGFPGPAGSVTGGVYPSAGIALSTGVAWGASITNNSADWNTAYTDRLKWDGGATGLNAATARTSLSLQNVTNESKATMFTSSVFTGTTTVASLIIEDLTDGYIPYQKAADDKLSNGNMWTDGTKVGVGTTAPGALLEIMGTGTSLTGTVYYDFKTTKDHTNYKGIGLGYDSATQTGIFFSDTNAAASNMAWWLYDSAAWNKCMQLAGSTGTLTVKGDVICYG